MNVNLASKITGQFAPVLGGQFARYIHNYYHSIWNAQFPPLSAPALPELCHIVDFNLNPYVFSKPFCSNNPSNCCYTTTSMTGGPGSSPIFSNNTYVNKCKGSYSPILNYP